MLEDGKGCGVLFLFGTLAWVAPLPHCQLAQLTDLKSFPGVSRGSTKIVLQL